MLLIRFMADISVICSTKALVFLKPDTVNIMALAANATTITTQISIICLEEFNLLFIYSPLYACRQKTLQGTPIHPSILPYFRGKVNIKVFDVILYRIVIASQHKLLYHVYRRKYVIR